MSCVSHKILFAVMATHYNYLVVVFSCIVDKFDCYFYDI